MSSALDELIEECEEHSYTVVTCSSTELESPTRTKRSETRTRKRFQIRWLQDPEFKNWVHPGSTEFKCKCVACDVELFAGKSEIRKHAVGKKHKNLMRTFKPNSYLKNGSTSELADVSVAEEIAVALSDCVTPVLASGGKSTTELGAVSLKDATLNILQTDSVVPPSATLDVCPPLLTNSKRKYGMFETNMEFMKACTNALEKNNLELHEYDAVGKNVAAKLKRMDTDQALYAEALINRVLTRGLLKTLNQNTDFADNIYIVQQNIGT